MTVVSVLMWMNATKNAVQDPCFSNTKIPYQLIVGDKEMEESITVRVVMVK